MQTIIAGSIRPPHRLKHTGIISDDKCAHPECKAARVDTGHVFWHCYRWTEARKPFIAAVDGYIAKVKKVSHSRYVLIRNMMGNTAFLRCGTCLADVEAVSSMHAIQEYDPLNDNKAEHMLYHGDDAPKYTEIHNEFYAHVYTDGSCLNGTDRLLAWTGWGVYFAEGPAMNCKSMLHGPVQSSYRAEVRALLHVVRSSVARTVIMIDCKSVLDMINCFLKSRKWPATELQEQDLWDDIFGFCEKLPENYFIAMWMPSHLDEEKNKEKREHAIITGLVTAEDITGNCRADALAKAGANDHITIDQYAAAAADRKRITAAAQRMYLALWNLFLSDGPQEQRDADQNDINALEQYLENLEFEAGEDDFDYDPFAEMPDSRCDEPADTAVLRRDVPLRMEPACAKEGDVPGGASASSNLAAHQTSSHRISDASVAINADATQPAEGPAVEEDKTLPIMERFPHYGWPTHNSDTSISYGWYRSTDPSAFGAVKVPGVNSCARTSVSKRKLACYRISMEMWEPFVDWVRRTDWSHFGLGACPHDSTRMQRRATWVEIALAYQIQDGINLGSHGLNLAYQEKICRAMLCKVAAMSKFLCGGKVIPYNELWHAAKYIDSIKPLIGHSRSGVCRRPIIPQEVCIRIATLCTKAHAENNAKDKFGVGHFPGTMQYGSMKWIPSAMTRIYELLEKTKDPKTQQRCKEREEPSSKKGKVRHED